MTVLGPAVILAYSSWAAYEAQVQEKTERIERVLDVLEQQTVEILQTVEVIFRTTHQLVAGLSDEKIRQTAGTLHDRLHKVIEGSSAATGLWVTDSQGNVLVASNLPSASGLSVAQRPFFLALRNADGGLYVSDLFRSAADHKVYFTLAVRRSTEGDGFGGVLALVLSPDYFSSYYARLSPLLANACGLAREDGSVLARFPTPTVDVQSLPKTRPLVQAIEKSPVHGSFRGKSGLDGVERILGYRHISGYPLYLFAGIDVAAIRAGWWSIMQMHLLFGIPATLFLWLATFAIIRRTVQWQGEAERRSAAEASLRQLQKLEAIGQLTGSIAHDFNNFLTVIGASLDRLKALASDNRAMRLIEAAEHSVDRATRLTSSLLVFSRRQRVRPETLSPNQLIREFGDLLRRAAGDSVELELSLDPDVEACHVDRGQFEAALLNLTVNARDALAGAKGRVTIETKMVLAGEHDGGAAAALSELPAGRYIRVSVSDTGQGMSREVLEHAFEPFYTTKDVGKGTGLGLAQVYGFAKQCGGAARITSEPQAGTTVELYLPARHGAADGAAAAASTPAEAMRSSKGETVLAVEDDPYVRAVVADSLRALGYRVLTADDGIIAQEILRRERDVDLLISDVMLPNGVLGGTLAASARALHPRIKVLLISGYVPASSMMDIEGFPLMRKPFSDAELGPHCPKCPRW